MIQEIYNTIATTEFAYKTWPENKRITISDAIIRVYPEKLKDINALVSRASKTDNNPVIAVVGTLNAGKSSLTALFLLENGRSRVLRGVSQNQGTQIDGRIII